MEKFMKRIERNNNQDSAHPLMSCGTDCLSLPSRPQRTTLLAGIRAGGLESCVLPSAWQHQWTIDRTLKREASFAYRCGDSSG